MTPDAIPFCRFLEDFPPGQEARILDLNVGRGFRAGYAFHTPDLILHCPSDECGGPRAYVFSGEELSPVLQELVPRILPYTCRNCLSQHKLFALRMSHMQGEDNATGVAMKIGEDPAFGPPVPSRVNRLVGPDRELFLRGRRAEAQGLGLGAVAYYRRVVEDQWRRLIGQICEVARRAKLPESDLARLEQAHAEHQFTRAVELARDVIPPSLLIDGHHNPLALLHHATSEDLHDGSDERCLEIAAAIRTVLYELADRISVALKERTELEAAITRLLNRSDNGEASPSPSEESTR